MHYYQFHIGDYRSATGHLSNDEDLAYRRLLDMYYDSEQPIPLETHWVARRIRMDTDIVEIVLNDMFQRTEDGWRHGRCDAYIAEYHARAERNRANGKNGGRPKTAKKNPVGSQTEPSGKATINQETIEPKNQDKLSNARARLDGFDEFWAAFDKKVERPGAERAWAKINPDGDLIAQIIDAAHRYRQATPDKAYRKHPATWLNNQCWNDEIVLKPQGGRNGYDKRDGFTKALDEQLGFNQPAGSPGRYDDEGADDNRALPAPGSTGMFRTPF